MCERLTMPDGSVAIVCGGHRGRRRPCTYPGCRRPGEIECDGPRPNGKTCDRVTCRAHAKAIGPDRDLCWQCAIAARRQPSLLEESS